MIKIYLDWNIFSYLKKPENKSLRDKIQKLTSQVLFPYSQSHFRDLSKSYSPTNEYFDIDLDTLEKYTRNFKISQVNGEVSFEEYNPRLYFQNNKEQFLKPISINLEDTFNSLDGLKIGDTEMNFGSLLKSLLKVIPANIPVNDENMSSINSFLPNANADSSFWDIMNDITSTSEEMIQSKDKYLEVRNQIGNSGLKLPSHSGAWKIEDVIKNINDFLKKIETNMSFAEYSNLIFKYRNKKPNSFESFTMACTQLDMIGFKSDKLPKKTDTLLNITTDAEHAYFASFCDYFIVNDKNLRIKSQVLYSEFKFETEVLNLQEFENLLDEILNTIPKNFTDFLSKAKATVKKENLIESQLSSSENEFDAFGYKIKPLFLNYFNAVIHQIQENNTQIFAFKRVYKSRGFSYKSEVEPLLASLVEILGFPLNYLKFKEKKSELLNSEKEVYMCWQFHPVTVVLQKDDDMHRVLLKIIIEEK